MSDISRLFFSPTEPEEPAQVKKVGADAILTLQTPKKSLFFRVEHLPEHVRFFETLTAMINRNRELVKAAAANDATAFGTRDSRHSQPPSQHTEKRETVSPDPTVVDADQLDEFIREFQGGFLVEKVGGSH